MKVFKILGTGSRIWYDETRVKSVFNELNGRILKDPELGKVREYDQILFIHGACPSGFDHMGAAVAAGLGWAVDPHPADWDHCDSRCPRAAGHRRVKKLDDADHPGESETYCPRAGMRRNAEMVALKPDLCVGFIRGFSIGTNGCLQLAENAGVAVIRLQG